jgi:hypothetical protein
MPPVNGGIFYGVNCGAVDIIFLYAFVPAIRCKPSVTTVGVCNRRQGYSGLSTPIRQPLGN